MQEPDGGAVVGEVLERQEAVEQLGGGGLGIAWQERGEGVEDDEVERVVAVQRFEGGEESVPFRFGRPGATEGAGRRSGGRCWPRAKRRQRTSQSAVDSSETIRRGRRRRRGRRAAPAVGDAGEQKRGEGGLAGLGRADEGSYLAGGEVAVPEPWCDGALGGGEFGWVEGLDLETLVWEGVGVEGLMVCTLEEGGYAAHFTSTSHQLQGTGFIVTGLGGGLRKSVVRDDGGQRERILASRGILYPSPFPSPLSTGERGPRCDGFSGGRRLEALRLPPLHFAGIGML